MRVLLVEDSDEDAARLIGAVGPASEVSFERASSRHAAEALLESDRHFDLVICDLRIPAQDDGIDRAPQHGLAVQAAAGRALPGCPIVFLTGVAEANIDELSGATSGGAVTNDLVDGRTLDMVRLFRKDRLLACAQEILDLSERLRILDEILLDADQVLLDSLDEVERRAVCLAARQWDGVKVAVRELGGGLSGGRTLHAVVSDSQHERASVFLKVAWVRDCRDEEARYKNFVAGTLSPTAFPNLTHLLGPCLGRLGCLVYKFADDCDGSVFEHLGGGVDETAIVREIRGLTQRWEAMTESTSVSFGQLREGGVSIEGLQTAIQTHDDHPQELLAAIDVHERRSVELVKFPQHGDLHGENILLSSMGQPTLIDCGDIGFHPAGLDPIALELGLVVHPASPIAQTAWPSRDAARQWEDLDAYVEGCPHADLVRACRAWGVSVAGAEGLRAVAYQYVTRRLKYDDTPKPILIAMLRGLLGL